MMDRDPLPELAGEYVRILVEGVVILGFLAVVALWAGIGGGAI